MIFFDFETCGFHGMAVCLQWAEDEGPINLHDIWMVPVGDTLQLLEYIASQDVVGFNLTFDWFHMQKLYTTFLLFAEKYGFDAVPEDYIDEIAELEDQARLSDFVIKPKSALDLMLHARKGPYQSLMARKDIRIKKVPSALANSLARELEDRVEIDGIYFSRRKDKYAPNWVVYDRKDTSEFQDVCLKFSASGALKVLAEHALGVESDSILKFVDVEVEKQYYPYEVGWAPFANAVSSKEKHWRVKVKKAGKFKIRYAWPAMIRHHIAHWGYNELARKYGADDVDYTRRLYHHFGDPATGDDDSELACMVGCVRFRGFNIDLTRIKEQRRNALLRMTGCPIAPNQAKAYIGEMMDEIEMARFESTKKVALEKIAAFKCDCTMDLTDGDLGITLPGMDFAQAEDHEEGPCPRCEGTKEHPAAVRAQEVLDARKAGKEVEMYDKLIQAQRLHASLKVIGTLSSRMAGADGLNVQGINHSFEVRDCFYLADDGFLLCGGDFDSFEVVLADAAYDDEALRRELTEQRPCQKCDQTGKVVCDKCKPGGCKKCSDTKIITCDECNGTLLATYKIHGLFGMELSGLSYAEVIKSKGSKVKDWYSIGKSGVFAMIYGGDWNTLVNKQGIDPERAKRAEEGFVKRFPGIQRARQKIFDSFCSMRQAGGIGSKIIWRDPVDYIESLMGFRRYFTLENKICAELFNLANKAPPAWKQLKIKVIRRDREQTVSGAVSSALYAAAFAIQAANMRAAANHVIQSSGATITKKVQRRIWDHQPSGVSRWVTVPLNIHDEIMSPTRPKDAEAIKQTVIETVESFRPKVPLIKMDWVIGAKSWAQAK